MIGVKMSKSVLILSGGLDSVILLNSLKSKGHEVHALSFNYGQRHAKELQYAKQWAEKLCSSHQIIDLDFMKIIASNSALTNHSNHLPEEHYTNANQKITVVPNRNMVMLSIGIALAENIGADAVYYGCHANDFTIYPDCRPDFVNALSKASELGTYQQVKVLAPFVNISKSDIVKLGSDLAVPFIDTWSCYKGEEIHCGKCATCQERIEAFQIAGVADPTPYNL
jgi:7-cyano-7-deazaguanine synthase